MFSNPVYLSKGEFLTEIIVWLPFFKCSFHTVLIFIFLTSNSVTLILAMQEKVINVYTCVAYNFKKVWKYYDFCTWHLFFENFVDHQSCFLEILKAVLQSINYLGIVFGHQMPTFVFIFSPKVVGRMWMRIRMIQKIALNFLKIEHNVVQGICYKHGGILKFLVKVLWVYSHLQSGFFSDKNLLHSI